MKLNPRRERWVKEGEYHGGPVVYWMSRDQRIVDNWALIHAQARAFEKKAAFAVAFTLVPEFLGATRRQYDFMLAGLREVEAGLREKGIPFHLLVSSNPARAICDFVETNKAGLLIADFDPLRVKKQWKAEVAADIAIPFVEVDAHNIIPAWIASQKPEVGARTLRPKIHRLLPEFLTEFPKLKPHPYAWPEAHAPTDWTSVEKSLRIDETVGKVDWIAPGEHEAHRALVRFVKDGLDSYADNRNDPNKQGQSNLSPYLHFGQLAAQRVALAVSNKYQLPASALIPQRSNAAGVKQTRTSPIDSARAFLEELIVRRELSDNFCLYNSKYDSLDGASEWAQKTLALHANDTREFIYSRDELAAGKTHDVMWNAAQLEMVTTGKMHGYMRMYWCKKILEWTPSAKDAIGIAIYLNDRYELDGRDPNGYAGVMWSIAGIHDRPWFDRPIFGLIRYMNANGLKKKFDTEAYRARFDTLS